MPLGGTSRESTVWMAGSPTRIVPPAANPLTLFRAHAGESAGLAR